MQEQRQLAVAAAVVGDRHAHDLHRIVARHEHDGFLRQAMAGVREARVAEAVAHFVVRRGRHGAGHGRPVFAGVFVADVQRLAMRIGNRVVVPWAQAVHAAVAAPRVAGAVVADEAAERFVRDCVRPCQRRAAQLVRGGIEVQPYHVLVAQRIEAAVAVEERQVFPFRHGSPAAGRDVAQRRQRLMAIRPAQARQLAAHDQLRGTLELFQVARCEVGRLPHNESLLDGCRVAVLVDDQHRQVEPLRLPVAARRQQRLQHQVARPGRVDDGQLAFRNAVGFPIGRRVGSLAGRVGPHGRLAIQYGGRQLVIVIGLRGRQAHALLQHRFAQLRIGQDGRQVHVRQRGSQRQRGIARVGRAQHEHEPRLLADTQRQRAAQRQRRVQYVAGGAGERMLDALRVRQVAAPAHEARAVRVELRLGATGGGVDHPLPGFVGTARAAMRQQRAGGLVMLRLHEQLGEGRMRCLVRLAIQHHFQVAGQLDQPRTAGQVRNQDAAQFHVVIGMHDHFHMREDAVGGHFQPHAGTAGAGGTLHIRVVRRGARLGAQRPQLVRLRIAQVEEPAFGVFHAVAIPARQRHVAGLREAGTGFRDQRGQAAVRQQARFRFQLRGGQWYSGLIGGCHALSLLQVVQAGAVAGDDLRVQQRAVFRRALQRLEIHVHDAEALREAERPFQIV